MCSRSKTETNENSRSDWWRPFRDHPPHSFLSPLLLFLRVRKPGPIQNKGLTVSNINSLHKGNSRPPRGHHATTRLHQSRLRGQASTRQLLYSTHSWQPRTELLYKNFSCRFQLHTCWICTISQHSTIKEKLDSCVCHSVGFSRDLMFPWYSSKIHFIAPFTNKDLMQPVQWKTSKICSFTSNTSEWSFFSVKYMQKKQNHQDRLKIQFL